MRGLLLTRSMAEHHADFLEQFRDPTDPATEPIVPMLMPESAAEPLSAESIEDVRGIYYSTEVVLGEAQREIFTNIARRAPNLEWVHMSSTGTNRPIFQELMDRGVIITNSTGVAAEPIALTVLGGMLALNRGFPRWFDSQRRHAWERQDSTTPDLRGQTVVILGLGAIGGHVARFVRPLGMHIIGVRRTPAGPEDGVDEWIASNRLGEALARADWLVIAVPLTPHTRHIIDGDALARLPRGAHIINVARGEVIDEVALIEALREGRLAGAHLDVFTAEPLPAESPLWDMPNVIITPHNATRSSGNAGRGDAIFREELQRWARGARSPRVVNGKS